MQPDGQGGHSQWHQQTRQSRVFIAISGDARTRACSGTCTRSLASSRGTRFERVTDKESRSISQPWLKALCEARPCSSRAGLRSYRPYATQGHPSDKKEKVRSCCVAKQNWSNLPVLPSPDTSTRGGGEGGGRATPFSLRRHMRFPPAGNAEKECEIHPHSLAPNSSFCSRSRNNTNCCAAYIRRSLSFCTFLLLQEILEHGSHGVRCCIHVAINLDLVPLKGAFGATSQHSCEHG